jgi:hypothetical protein
LSDALQPTCSPVDLCRLAQTAENAENTVGMLCAVFQFMALSGRTLNINFGEPS